MTKRTHEEIRRIITETWSGREPLEEIIEQLLGEVEALEHQRDHPQECAILDCNKFNCTAEVRDMKDEWQHVCDTHAKPFGPGGTRSRLKNETE